jgi:hypothetical protein
VWDGPLNRITTASGEYWAMGEERYWIVHRRTRTTVHRDRGGHPALRVLGWRASADVDDLLADVSADARARGNVALFRDVWAARDWGEDAARFTAAAGPLADGFRPRQLGPGDRRDGRRPGGRPTRSRQPVTPLALLA